MLFHLTFDQESNTKEVGDFLIFPTGIYLPLSDQRFRRYEILKGGGLLKLYFWTDYSGERKMKSDTVQLGFFP
jgi:hypothetical protein